MPCMLKSLFPAPHVFTRKTSCRLLHTNHSFHTYNLVKELELRGFARGQAVAIMKCLQAMLLDSSALIQSQMLSKSDLENGRYLFKAALSELRTEIQILHKNDWSALRLETASIQRELDVLNSKMKEDTTALKHEIQMDVNTRKAETRADQKKLEIKIEELNNKYTIALGDIRTDIEAVKWDTTRRGMMAIFGMGICAIFVTFLISEQKSNESKVEPFPSTEDQSTTLFSTS
ncbi:14389_t:CDS:2 [Ambispora leptoticha]|uniref:14389_t:CDS:1 n=1 Tax=Ambispora leptoticha TaxID=144679 RepID=A0A9N9DA92_9GLOM|nr:14389_t:CDS:2 [Ambispora leptoticha]